MNNVIDQLCIKSLRTVSIEEISQAKSGHPGIALGAAPIIHTLYSRVMKYNPQDPNWINRDRFVLAAGHGSSLLYAMLHLAGFNVTIDDLKNFRQLNSITCGHPEIGITPGVDCTSGPLGQGIAEAAGMAIGEDFLSHKYNKDNLNLIDHYTYVLCGDGDLQEGVTLEAASLAGHLGLHKLIVLYDSNDIQLDGPVANANTESVGQKFKAMNWNYIKVEDGEDVEKIHEAILAAQDQDKAPTIIEIKTIIGHGASNQGTSEVHGKPLPQEEVSRFRSELKGDAFSFSPEAYEYYQEVQKKNLEVYNKYQQDCALYQEQYAEEYSQFKKLVNDELVVDVDTLVNYNDEYNKATRVACGEYVKAISSVYPTFIGGSADLTGSTYAKGADGNYSKINPLGRNICFGVREHAMAAVCNGLTLHGGLKSFCGAFFVFSDYLKPSLRLSALMELPVTYIFSHDSVAVGEDGPTHEPIEQLSMLRSIPNCNVIRPCDINEVRQAFKLAMESKHTPTVIVTTRQNVPTVTGHTDELKNGGYIVKKEEHKLDGILIATGSEVSLAIKAAQILEEQGLGVRVVSLPSTYLFNKMPKEYQEEILPKNIQKRIAIEMSEASYLYRYIGLNGKLINIESFGRSGKAEEVIKSFGFTVENVVNEYHNL